MKKSELVKLLESMPGDPDIMKVNLDDVTGKSDKDMTPEDWGMGKNVKDSNGEIKEDILLCLFGSLEKYLPHHL